MLYYILQIIACQVLFLLVYDLFLKKETFFNYNRAYLLITALLSFVLPFIKIDFLKSVTPKNFIISLPEVLIGANNQNLIDNSILTHQLLSFIFLIGMFLATSIFSYKLIKIANLKFSNPYSWSGNVIIVKLLKSNAAFSFFNTIFLGEKIAEQQQDTILKHELVHVKHYHTIDLLVFEIMRIFLWFNPLIYMYQNRIKALHEYIADETAVKQNGKKDYYKQLLNQVFETQNLSFTNSFFNKSLIKKRIIMLQKSKSKKVSALKYALLIPVVLGMLFYVSCEKEVINDEIVSENNISESKSLQNLDSSDELLFSKVDKAPTFESCQNNTSQEEQKKCVNKEISKFVNQNFNMGLAETLGLPDGVQKIYTIFKIDKQGNVIDVKARASHPDLETEAKRIILQLPKFIAGEHNGEKVNVGYSLPIAFKINP